MIMIMIMIMIIIIIITSSCIGGAKADCIGKEPEDQEISRQEKIL